PHSRPVGGTNFCSRRTNGIQILGLRQRCARSRKLVLNVPDPNLDWRHTALHKKDNKCDNNKPRKRHPARHGCTRAGLFGLRFFLRPTEFYDIVTHAALSTRAATPMPPAVQTEISALLLVCPAKSLAVRPRIRAPVAANGWP